MNILRSILRLIFPCALGIVLILVVYWAIFPISSPQWTGFGPYDPSLGSRSKTLWEWLELLIVPLFLAIGIWWLDRRDKESKDRIETDRQNHETLEAYLDCMTNLLLKENLRASQTESEVVNIARTKTLSVLRSLDGSRKGEVLQFLYESKMISHNPIIRLTGADFSNAILRGATLVNIEIRGVNFNGADLKGAVFINALLNGCVFTGADFRNCSFDNTNLEQAILDKTNFSKVDLTKTILDSAIFDEANLSDTLLLPKQIDLIGSYKNAKMK